MTTRKEEKGTTMQDQQWEEHLASLKQILLSGSLKDCFAMAAEKRRALERWAAKIWDANPEAPESKFVEQVLEAGTSADEEDRFFFVGNQVAPVALWHWGARVHVDDVEYGIIADVPSWRDLGWSAADEESVGSDPEAEQAYEDNLIVINEETLEAWAEGGPDLATMQVRTFSTLEEAKGFANGIRESFRKGDHSQEVIKTEIRRYRKGTEFIVTLLVSDLNWEDKVPRAEKKDAHLATALDRISQAETRGELLSHVRECKKYSRWQQLLNSGRTFDRSRRINVSWDYGRFATAMNAIAARAEELGLRGFKTYSINEYEKTTRDGDLMDMGCREGEFVALNMPRDVQFSLWGELEGSWKPSRPLSPTVLTWHNPDFPIGPTADRKEGSF